MNLGGGRTPPTHPPLTLPTWNPFTVLSAPHTPVFWSCRAMAEGFTPADYITDTRLSEVQGKRLWLVRVPRHIDPARLEVSHRCCISLLWLDYSTKYQIRCVVRAHESTNATAALLRRWSGSVVDFLSKMRIQLSTHQQGQGYFVILAMKKHASLPHPLFTSRVSSL